MSSVERRGKAGLAAELLLPGTAGNTTGALDGKTDSPTYYDYDADRRVRVLLPRHAAVLWRPSCTT